MSGAMIDRLKLDDAAISGMIKGVADIRSQEEVVGMIESETKREDGLIIQKQRIPLGVIAMIFESRPNVVIDCSALAIKSGNAMILKGGKEAAHSNQILAEIVREAIKSHIPENTIQLLDSKDRSLINDLLKMKDEISVVIPRGGESLIEHVYKNATMPVIAHFKGLCHLYIHSDANLKQAHEIWLNGKVQRPGVCNALETLLVHKSIEDTFLSTLIDELGKEKVEIRADKIILGKYGDRSFVVAASESDWDTEYLDKILSIKMVDDEDEAINHIQKHGTFHTEAICAKDKAVIEKFKTMIDCSCIAVNASTRFNDGGQLGLGAELGISTTKFHAYGPMGAKEMTTTRFVIQGDGHIRK